MSYSPAAIGRPIRDLWAVSSPESIRFEAAEMVAGGSPSDNNYPAASVAIFVPFGVSDPITVVKMWVFNGTAVAGNIDMGIYRPDGTLVVAKGSTAHAGISAIQELDITDTVLLPGRYYMAISSDTSGVTQKLNNWAAPIDDLWRACGVYQQATAFPLPSPATFAVMAQVQVPLFGFSTRTLIA